MTGSWGTAWRIALLRSRPCSARISTSAQSTGAATAVGRASWGPTRWSHAKARTRGPHASRDVAPSSEAATSSSSSRLPYIGNAPGLEANSGFGPLYGPPQRSPGAPRVPFGEKRVLASQGSGRLRRSNYREIPTPGDLPTSSTKGEAGPRYENAKGDAWSPLAVRARVGAVSG